MERQEIEDKTFRFGCFDAEVFSEDFTLSSDGAVTGYQHPNEQYWDVVDGCLVLMNSDRNVTSRFQSDWHDQERHTLLGYVDDRSSPWLILSENSCTSQMRVADRLRRELYGGFSPLHSVDESFIDKGYPNTNLTKQVVDAILEVIKPTFWLELGSMVGGSAILAASAIKTRGLVAQILCIDPFTGDTNMWAWEKDLKCNGSWQFLGLKNGRPTILDRFLANVTEAGHSDIILPIIATSSVGLKLIRRLYAEGRLDEMPTVIYLDSAHEPGETLLELQKSWDLLAPGGVLFGDDWSWDAVRNDVIRFASTVELNHEISERLIEQHSSFVNVNGILLDEGQWLLVK